MITISRLTKRFKNRKVLDDVSLSFPRNGLISITGPSGCGKTTLLNCLSSFIDYEGDISINNLFLNRLSDKDQSDFRLRNFGYIFQDFKLYEHETVFNNILLPLDSISNASYRRKKQKCLDLIETVSLKANLNQPVNRLSGGEKQRVAIARALVNDPKIIMADEPTGALDSFNSIEIMKILRNIARHALVIIVSHDVSLMKQYADEIIHMRDGKIISVEKLNYIKETSSFLIGKNPLSNKKTKIPLSFLFSHSMNSVKKKKFRTLICTSVTSLGLIGVGLAVTISSLISKNITSAYSQIIDDSMIMASRKNEEESIYAYLPANYEEAIDIATSYPQYVMDVGVTYDIDYESFFPNRNEIFIASTTYRSVIDGISARSINEFRWIDYEQPTIYPQNLSSLKDDEIVLGLNIRMIRDICYELRIVKTVESLSDYLMYNDIYLCFDFANLNWYYEDEQLVKMVGFVFTNEPCIYHFNHRWNEHMFEEQMRFPTTEQNSNPSYPWIMKKIYYFHTYGNTDEFLDKCLYSEKMKDFALEIANNRYYPWLYHDVEIQKRHRVLFFLNSLKSIPLYYENYFLEYCSNLKKPIFGSTGGYSIYPYSMMMGFSHFTYFSSEEDLLYETMDASMEISIYGNEEEYVPKGVLSGHFTKTSENGVHFSVLDNENLFSGSNPKSLDDIVISSSMAKSLFGSNDVINKPLYLAFSFNERVGENNKILKDFKTYTLNICGVINSERNLIFHHNYWTVRFFQSRLDISIFELSANIMCFQVVDKNLMDESIDDLNTHFSEFEFVNPLSDLTEGVEEICFYIEIALIVFSLIAIVVSSLLLTISNYLHVLENSKDVGLARCLGFNKREAKKFLYTYSIIISLTSFLIASIQLVVLSIVISIMISKSLELTTMLQLNPIAFLYMFILDLGISLISSFIISQRISKINPIEVLKI